MASSINELYLARVTAVLRDGLPAPLSAHVHRGRVDALSPEDVPGINVRRGPATHNDYASAVDHAYLEFDLDCYVRGDDWETTSDELHMQAHALLAVDPQLTTMGKGLRCIRTVPGAEPGDETLGRLRATYQVQHLVRINDLTKPVR